LICPISKKRLLGFFFFFFFSFVSLWIATTPLLSQSFNQNHKRGEIRTVAILEKEKKKKRKKRKKRKKEKKKKKRRKR